jgi:hypothetical protein
MAHVLNLAVQDFLKELKASCKEFNAYITSTQKNELLVDLEADSAFLKVILDFNIIVASFSCKTPLFCSKESGIQQDMLG